MAQGGSAVVVNEVESYTQATYTLESANKRAVVTIRKEQGQVSILLKSANGQVLGKGRVKNVNGNPVISLKQAKPGTLPFWRFAFDRIIPDGQSGTSLSPRKKALAKCNQHCKDKIRNHPALKVFTVTGPGGQSITGTTLQQAQKAFQAYQRCMWECMKRAKARYQQN